MTIQEFNKKFPALGYLNGVLAHCASDEASVPDYCSPHYIKGVRGCLSDVRKESLADPKATAMLDEMSNLLDRMEQSQTPRFMELFLASQSLHKYLCRLLEVDKPTGEPVRIIHAMRDGVRDRRFEEEMRAKIDATPEVTPLQGISARHPRREDFAAILDDVDACGDDTDAVMDKVTRHLSTLCR